MLRYYTKQRLVRIDDVRLSDLWLRNAAGVVLHLKWP
jgi:hypothetical protein